ncbi:MAG: Rrf2 family transcriptional regulator [Bacteroidetes bacterium GWE2_29_8]|nr:MAG: Rrf2 family transcriptional regulator [Bacteroidetes bacterium GWE2_29_8]OFY20088.1 MAG: Rrf2 family transcriptional regulator [Bacteroidetes bacterium GWF2_29_10]
MSKIFQLSEAVSLALHSMVLIAQADKMLNVNQIAEFTGASKNHLAKILQRLVKEGFLKANRGPTGGYLIKKKPEEITLANIYVCIEGPIESEGCPMGKTVCPFDRCIMSNVIGKMSQKFNEYLNNTTLKDFIS